MKGIMKMKKLLLIICLLSVLLSLGACGRDENEDDANQDDANQVAAVKVDRKWKRKKANELAEKLIEKMQDGREFSLMFPSYSDRFKEAGLQDIALDSEKEIEVLTLSESVVRKMMDEGEITDEWYDQMYDYYYQAALVNVNNTVGVYSHDRMADRVAFCSVSRVSYATPCTEKGGEIETWFIPTNHEEAYISVTFSYGNEHIVNVTVSLVMVDTEYTLEEALNLYGFGLENLSER